MISEKQKVYIRYIRSEEKRFLYDRIVEDILNVWMNHPDKKQRLFYNKGRDELKSFLENRYGIKINKDTVLNLKNQIVKDFHLSTGYEGNKVIIWKPKATILRYRMRKYLKDRGYDISHLIKNGNKLHPAKD